MPETTPPTYQPGGVVTPPAADPVAATIARVEAIVDRLYLNMLEEVRKVEAERDAAVKRADEAEAERDRLAVGVARVRDLLEETREDTRAMADDLTVPSSTLNLHYSRRDGIKAALDTLEADRG